MRKLFYLFLVSGLSFASFGCSKYITNQELEQSLQRTTLVSNQYAQHASNEASLAVYECVSTQGYASEAGIYCTPANVDEGICAIAEVWDTYCLVTEVRNGTEVLSNPRPGVTSALRSVIARLRSEERRNNPVRETSDQIVDMDHVRTLE